MSLGQGNDIEAFARIFYSTLYPAAFISGLIFSILSTTIALMLLIFPDFTSKSSVSYTSLIFSSSNVPSTA